MDPWFTAERAIDPATGTVRWVVADSATLELHLEATAFIASLRSRGLSPNTERAYASRIALYLNHCAGSRLDWRAPSFLSLSGFQRWLVTEPLPPRGGGPRQDRPVFRSQNTANAVMTAIAAFLRFCVANGWVAPRVAGLLSQPKYLVHVPASYDAGEGDQFRTVGASAFRFRITEPGYENLTPDQIAHMISIAARARDRFLIALLACTGVRIGEGLGLRRQDMHLLASSRALGCTTNGPHIHIHRRTDNPNRALAKARKPRTIPVTADLTALYTDYRYERDAVPQAADGDMVFVNLFRPPLGRAMSYPNTKDMFDRLARAARHPARPHMLRHSAATTWLRDGVDRDVVQYLLGHVSPLSMERYRHVDDTETRAAVERLEALREHQ
ncbi:integrase/recombinase XerD [Kitasatospora sp. MAP12-15]|uniref:tyrosine-type recombinase/integrase n=1 Tax=unclassified Kitasatospora TaxID=2633591 RepID=UPI0024732103|nr:tyrosine-type recombinase/integrase [Kitasatospora sp. MAP12-44]MDH6107789.1 integrase/recombinase XerD [Kitasatospora sp. MAP12-44]MDH6108003.1 integrase/recombinase XerD [Kitasatospora sp. MAP12-44]